jgi:hypothetical protein
MEIDERLDERVRLLLKRELDIKADRLALGHERAAIAGLHDAGAAARDDSIPALDKKGRRLLRHLIHFMTRLQARGPEDRDRVINLVKAVKSFDEFRHNAEDPPLVHFIKILGRRLVLFVHEAPLKVKRFFPRFFQLIHVGFQAKIVLKAINKDIGRLKHAADHAHRDPGHHALKRFLVLCINLDKKA